MIWSSEDVARDAVRRQGAGMPAARVAEAVAQAAVRERETAEELRCPGPVERGGLVASPDPAELAEMWVARHAEWRRVQALVEASGWAVYEPERDSVGSAWAAERTVRREQALAAHATHMERRREAAQEVCGEVWVAAGPGRRLRQVASRAGLTPQEVLAQLAGRVVVGEDGAVSVAPFIPSR
ncbi:hypothetical protein ABZ851_33235 [Streptomyces sp. NPDC047049]|uniref:hypothetical protein n=1 Tax=Streptomyces sp. NPDC047049 TaxID=3156688 RepID=UPI0033C03F59